jgi:hypothetical protein
VPKTPRIRDLRADPNHEFGPRTYSWGIFLSPSVLQMIRDYDIPVPEWVWERVEEYKKSPKYAYRKRRNEQLKEYRKRRRERERAEAAARAEAANADTPAP